MNEPVSYQEIALHQQRESSVAYAADIGKLWKEALGMVDDVQALTIRTANATKDIGHRLQLWMDKEQMKFEQFETFFRDHSHELPAGLTSAAGRKFIEAHRAYPNEIKDIKTAQTVLMQMTFFAFGLLDEPKRLLQQTASGRSFFESLTGLWSKETEMIEKFKDQYPIAQWDRNTWQVIVDATKRSAELYQRGRDVLKNPGP